MTPLPAKSESVFLESYTDSPEFTHVENPVVHMEEELLPGEQGGSPAPSMPRLRARPHRQHPLSQVIYPDSFVSPEDTRRRVLPTEAPVLASLVNPVDKSMLLTDRHPNVLGNDGIVIISDDEDEEDEDEN